MGQYPLWQLLCASVLPIVAIGTVLVRWVLSGQNALKEQVDHKHRNVDMQFTQTTALLDKLTGKIEDLTKDNVLLNERMRNQENQVREFKTEIKEFKGEVKDSIKGLSTTLDARLKEMTSATTAQLEQVVRIVTELSRTDHK